MSALTTLRHRLTAAPLRGFALLLALCVIGAGGPRFLVHSHHDHGHGHAHPAVEQADHHDERAGDLEAPLGTSTHVHDAAGVSAALAGVPQIDVPSAPLTRWCPGFDARLAASAAGPPPQRPPIA